MDLAPGLQYFGRSIHGTMDMNNDGSVDLAVGSLGAAVLLWWVFERRLDGEKENSTAAVSRREGQSSIHPFIPPLAGLAASCASTPA